MKILIADDESLARSVLKSILQELDLPLEGLKEAVDGEQMIEQVKRYAPELVFVDIRMPKLNGLEAIEEGKKFSPYTRWVILTGYPEFSYAQQAIKLGASDYLLKPVDPEEVKKLVNEARRGNTEWLLNRNRQFESQIADLYQGLSSLQQEDQESFLLKAHFTGAVFCIDSNLIEVAKAERRRDFLQTLHTRLDHTVVSELRQALFTLSSGESALVVAWEPTRYIQGKQYLSTLLYPLKDLYQQFNDNNFCITILETDDCSSYNELYEKLNCIQHFSLLRTICGIGKTLYIADLVQYTTQQELLEVCSILIKISDCYGKKTYLSFMKALDTLESKLCENNTLNHHTKTCIANFLNRTVSCQLEAHQDTTCWKQVLQACGEELLIDEQKKDKQDIVDQVVSFIDENYMFEIGVGQIAMQLHVTPNYLSSLFHKKMGMTFMKYLTHVRMLRAKELLTDSKLSIQEVAEQVGYYSSRHFTKTFTELFGYYPSDCRKKSIKSGALRLTEETVTKN